MGERCTERVHPKLAATRASKKREGEKKRGKERKGKKEEKKGKGMMYFYISKPFASQTYKLTYTRVATVKKDTRARES